MRNAIMLAVMILASGLAWALKPSVRLADQAERFSLEIMIPRQIGEWREVRLGGAQIVDPVQKATLDKIYNQTLTRAYVDASGYMVMLSIAYGSDQSDGLQMHLPDLCYPAQGFQVDSRKVGTLDLPDGSIPATRLVTSLGARKEPLTYWTIVGDRAIIGGIQKKLVEMRYGLMGGVIPDGMLVRVSSIDADSARAYAAQGRFAEAMVGAVANDSRARLVGSLSAR